MSGLCEWCGKQPGTLNSRHYFNNPISDPDCGDWVCLQCEEEANSEHNRLVSEGYSEQDEDPECPICHEVTGCDCDWSDL